MKLIDPGLSRRLHLLLHKTGKMDAKISLVRHYSGGRTASSNELYDNEALSLVRHLEQYSRQIGVDQESKSNIMRKKIISILREYGFEVFDKDKSRMIADMKRIYAFVKEVGYLKKGLNRYTESELPKLVSQIESIYIKQIKS